MSESTWIATVQTDEGWLQVVTGDPADIIRFMLSHRPYNAHVAQVVGGRVHVISSLTQR